MVIIVFPVELGAGRAKLEMNDAMPMPYVDLEITQGDDGPAHGK